MSNIIIAPSLLASNWGRLEEEVIAVEAAGADWHHLDVMDGHFVPPITFGPQFVAAAKKVATKPLDVHLMIEKPEGQIKHFRDAGADNITVHLEACPDIEKAISLIHNSGATAGVSIKPNTQVELLKPVIGKVDLILIMTVEPGWGGQPFIENTKDKIKAAKEYIKASGKKIHLEVDGGINETTAKICRELGATAFVAGSYIFGSNNYKERISLLRS